MKYIAIICIPVALLGCMTEPKLEATKPWENHYYTVDQLKQAVESMQLEENESVWMMSNHTLNRLLKNVRK